MIRRSAGNSTELRTLGLALALAWLGGSVVLEAQDLRGTLYGSVTSEDGLSVPGATVTVSSPSLVRGSETRVANERGSFRFSALPPGVYRVTTEIAGFQSLSRENIVLEAGAALAIDFVMRLSTVTETITVSGEAPLVDVRSNQVTRTVDDDVLENIPTGRTLQDMKLLVPGVNDAQYPLSPQTSLYGASPRDTQYNVDGANMNDPVVGYMLTELSYDAIDEVQITTAGISAEFGQGGAGVFNFITRSGGNEYSGTAHTYFQNDSLQGDNVSQDLRNSGFTQGSGFKKQLDFGATFGGPILRDKLWFFANAKRVELEQTRPDFPAFDPTADDTQYFAKGTWQPSGAITLQGSYSLRETQLFPDDRTVGFQFNDSPETWATGDRPIDIWHLGSTVVVSDQTLVDVRYSQSLAGFNKLFPLDEPAIFDLATDLVCCGQSKIEGKQQRRAYNIKGSLSHYNEGWAGGSHELKTGLEVTYGPNSLIRDQPEDMFLYARNGMPERVRLYNTPREPRQSVLRYAGYVQDEWSFQRLTLNLGVRVEATKGWLPEQQGGGGLWSAVETFAGQDDLVDWLTVAPRLGFVWDVRGNQETSIKASYGRYYKPLLTLHVGVANANGTGFQEFDWNDLNGDLAFQNGEQGTLRRNSLPGSSLIDPNLRDPYVDEVNIGVDQSLGNDFSLSVAGLYKRERDLMETVSVSHPFSAYNSIDVANPIDGGTITIFALDPAFQSVQQVEMLTNPNDPAPLERTYYGVEVVARRRMIDNWQFQTSLNIGRSEGNVGTNFGQSSGVTSLYLDPNSLTNAFGPLDWDSPVQLKIQATYRAPQDIALSAFYVAATGVPLRTDTGFPNFAAGAHTLRFARGDVPGVVAESFIEVNGQPRGTNRADTQNLLSLRVERQFQIRDTARLDLTADIFNVFNSGAIGAVQTVQFGHPNFLQPSRIERARNLRVGVRFSF